jgi:predicted transcriptional regulator
MAQSLVEIAKELTLTLVETGRLSSEDMQDMLQKTHATLAALRAQEEFGTATAVSMAKTAPVEWRKSITKRTVTCLECGQTFKQLSRRHLRMHGLDGRSYHAKYGIPQTQPLAARNTIARRREVIRKTRPWEKAPMFRRAQTRHGNALPEPEADIPRDEIAEPTVAAPTSPKRQRKTAAEKKIARKKSTQA